MGISGTKKTQVWHWSSSSFCSLVEIKKNDNKLPLLSELIREIMIQSGFAAFLHTTYIDNNIYIYTDHKGTNDILWWMLRLVSVY